MTTGATGQLGLALPVQGELSGTWGDTVNNGITQYTNIAIAGTLTLTGDGAVTLTNTTGDASASNITSTLAGAGTVTAQFAIVKVSGTTTTKVVTGPSYSKTYVVDNASSFAVTFKASGQTGVSVAAAEKVTVVFNGTDYIKLAGTIANAAGSNTQIQFNNGGLFGASANLTWDGTTLSSTQVNITGQGTLRLQDTTGGEYVGLRSPSALGASYTLTFPADDGTSGQALITDGSGVLSWSTAASGDVYGPASATDNALARFDGTTGKIIQDSVVIVSDTGAVTGVTDLAASGSVTLSGGTANGVTYLNGSKVLTSGSALTFDGTNLGVNGRFVIDGIVASAPANGGMFRLSNESNYFTGKTTGSGGAVLSNGDGTATIQLYKNSPTSYMVFESGNGTEAMRLTSTSLYTASGINVGIGNNNPLYKLDVADQARFAVSGGSAQLRLERTGGGAGASWLGADSDNLLVVFNTSFSAKLTLDSAGNLGLGVTPSAWNSVYKGFQIGLGASVFGRTATSTAAITSNAFVNSAGNFQYINTEAASYYLQGSGQHFWTIAASGTAGTNISFTQAMTLSAAGGLSVGTTTDAGAGNLLVNGLGTFTATTANGARALKLIGRTTTNDSQIGFFASDGTTSQGFFNSSASKVSFYTASSLESVIFLADGRLRTLSTISVGDANPSTSGAGITFPATQSASSDANTLDDYEEGTWTPTIANLTIGNGSTSGRYTKIGRVVTVEVYVEWGSTTSASGAWSVNNLPFTSAATQRSFGSCNILDSGTENYWGGVQVTESSTTLAFLALISNLVYTAQTSVTASVPMTWTTSDAVRASVTYTTS